MVYGLRFPLLLNGRPLRLIAHQKFSCGLPFFTPVASFRYTFLALARGLYETDTAVGWSSLPLAFLSPPAYPFTGRRRLPISTALVVEFGLCAFLFLVYHRQTGLH
jgi:hypothetical protein